jgi:Glycosyl hydrolase family 63 C-terminal domain
LYIADAIYGGERTGLGLWNEEDGFFYDKISTTDGQQIPLKVRSLVGLLPMLAMETFPSEIGARFLEERLSWFMENRPYMRRLMTRWQDTRTKDTYKDIMMLAMVRGDDLRSILTYMLNQEEFLSDYGIRGISKYHEAHPYVLQTPRRGTYSVNYQPGESTTGDFGGNSNWRGPIWFPINFLLVEVLYKYHRFYGNDVLVEYPTGSGTKMTLGQVADDLSRRLTNIFLRDEQGHRPVFGTNTTFQNDPNWRDHIPFHEYFHGDTGRGVGASHQTGWTAVVANLLQHTS